jgi:hypothetical protein
MIIYGKLQNVSITPLVLVAYFKFLKIKVVTNTLIKTTVRNKYLFVLDFIVHYYNMFRPRSVAILR